MSYFEGFTEEEVDLIVSLPYRVGIWMSHTDDVITDQDDEKEHKALESILKTLAKSDKQTPFVSAVVQATLAYKDRWPGWQDKQAQLLEEARWIARITSVRMPEDNAKNYCNMLMQVATVVAEAYGEFGGDFDEDEKQPLLAGLIDKVIDRFSGAGGDAMNISAAEDSALEQLADALQG